MGKILFFVLLIIFNVSSRSRFIERFTSSANDTIISNFDGGAGTEWLTSTGADSVKNDSAHTLHGTRSVAMYTNVTAFGPASIYTHLSRPIVYNPYGLRRDVELTFYVANKRHVRMPNLRAYMCNTSTMTTNCCVLASGFIGNSANDTLSYVADSLGWIHVKLQPVDSGAAVALKLGTYDSTNINYIRIQIQVGNQGTLGTPVVFDQFKISNGLSKAIITMTMQDGFTSQYTMAKPIFDRYGFKTTLFPIGEIMGQTINGTPYMSLDTLKLFQAAGYTVGSSSWYDGGYLTDLSSYRIDTMITCMDSILRVNGIRGRSLFYSLFAKRSLRLDSIVSNHYTFMKSAIINRMRGLSTTNAVSCPLPLYSYRLCMPSNYWDTTTNWTTPTVKRIIDSVCSYKVHFNLGFHSFYSGAKRYLGCDMLQLDTILSYLKTKVDAGVLEAGGLEKILTYAPDSCIIRRSKLPTSSTIAIACSLSTDADSMKIYLKDNLNNIYDSTAMIKGGSLFTLTRSSLTSGITYKYKMIGLSNSGTIDSTFALDSVRTLPSYTVTYNGNSNTGGSPPAPVSQDSGSLHTVNGKSTLSRTGHTFARWNTAANGSGTSYDSAGSLRLNGNVTLYAQWVSTTPVIDSIRPNPWYFGKVFTIYGRYLDNITSIRLGDTSLGAWISISSMLVNDTIPIGMPRGKYPVRLNNTILDSLTVFRPRYGW